MDILAVLSYFPGSAPIRWIAGATTFGPYELATHSFILAVYAWIAVLYLRRSPKVSKTA